MHLSTHATLSLLAGSAFAASAAGQTVVTFDDGPEGWSGTQGIGGSTVLESDGGNPGANLHTTFDDFGITFRNSTNPAFVTDFTASPTVTFSVDVSAYIEFFGLIQPRPWVLELRDYDNVPDGYPWVSVYYTFAWIGDDPAWTTWSVTIDDTSATALPSGWGGTGAEGEFGAPILPANRTFADVLAGVDEFTFTTYEPGYFFTNSLFDVRIDNVTVDTGDAGCAGDTDGNGEVSFDDLLSVLSLWGECPAPCPADVNGDGTVDFDDLLTVLSTWGPCP